LFTLRINYSQSDLYMLMIIYGRKH